MMKKVLLAAALASLTFCAQAAYKDGTYTGKGQGNASEVTVQVTVKGGKMTAMKVIKHGETPMLLEAAEKKLARQMVAKQKAPNQAKVCSGATNSSKAIIKAVESALAKAK